jgi:L-seryl-tRNA(Ser) seleniumtransferase
MEENRRPPEKRPPSMDWLLSLPQVVEAERLYGREAVKEELRRAIAAGQTDPLELAPSARRALDLRFTPTLSRAVNATGVLLHTNLGRSPLSDPAREALLRIAAGYSTLEYDPATGERGHRQAHVRSAARDLFGAEDALAVNNNAAAIFLCLCALARGRRVLVSRGELVAIGGSFKIPEILESSGAVLAEVGTTNRTSIEDYRRALSPDAALLLTVHPSNYEIRGYTRRPLSGELAALAREAKIPWVHDHGTGSIVPLDEFGVAGEATVASCLADGADVVTFSADKLFAGPQAGFIAGRADILGRLAAHPVRPDKLTLAALGATIAAWKTGRWRDFPIYRAAGQSLESLQERGERIRDAVRGRASAMALETVAATAFFGGGTSPEKPFPSRALAISLAPFSAEDLAARLRGGSPPIVARIEDGRLLLDLRSIAPDEDPEVADALARLAAETPGPEFDLRP